MSRARCWRTERPVARTMHVPAVNPCSRQNWYNANRRWHAAANGCRAFHPREVTTVAGECGSGEGRPRDSRLRQVVVVVAAGREVCCYRHW